MNTSLRLPWHLDPVAIVHFDVNDFIRPAVNSVHLPVSGAQVSVSRHLQGMPNAEEQNEQPCRKEEASPLYLGFHGLTILGPWLPLSGSTYVGSISSRAGRGYPLSEPASPRASGSADPGRIY